MEEIDEMINNLTIIKPNNKFYYLQAQNQAQNNKPFEAIQNLLTYFDKQLKYLSNVDKVNNPPPNPSLRVRTKYNRRIIRIYVIIHRKKVRYLQFWIKPLSLQIMDQKEWVHL